MLDSVVIGKIIQKCREQKKLSQELVSGLAGIGTEESGILNAVLWFRILKK